MSRKILIVDNEPAIQEVVRICLEAAAGWHVTVASSGQEGIEQAIAVQPDAILLDVMMPDMDGPMTYQKLQENAATRNIPVILLTAKIQAGDRAQYEQLGMTAIIAKPFNPTQLADQVRQCLGWASDA